MNIAMKAACAAATLALASQAAAGPACWTPREVESARVRDLQTIMMVGALRCSAAGYNTAFGYDRFVVRHRAELARHNDVLKAHFYNAGGRQAGNRDYDAFTTALANAHSSGSDDMRGYCDRVDWLVRTAASTPSDELVLFAEEISERPHGVGETCPAGDDRRGPLAAAPLPPALPPVEAVTPPVQVAAAPAEPAAPEPTVQTAAAVEPVATPVQDAVVPAPADTAEALKAATAALKAATAALEAAMAARPAPDAKPIPASASEPVRPAATGPRRAPVTPTVLEPSPVVPPEVTSYVG
jgi:hypothetical protein